MRFFAIVGIPFAFLASCSQAPPLKPQSEVQPSIARKVEIPTISSPTQVIEKVSSNPAEAPKITSRNIAGVSFTGVSFDSNLHRLAVVDQPNGPGSRFPDSQSAAASRNGIAAINAGFFTPEGAPLGKLISGGKPAGSWNRASSLGSGVFFETSRGNLALARRESVSPNSPQRELLQAGPMLIENGRAVGGLDTEKSATRILILWDGASRWWIGRGSACTLAQLAGALGQASPAGWPIKKALNLDGGRSADLWISGNVAGGPFVDRPMWNRPVRNFLVLLPK